LYARAPRVFVIDLAKSGSSGMIPTMRFKSIRD
jgi:hypothetical protein